MKVFLSIYNVGKVSRYILRHPRVQIDSIGRIGDYWLMTLSHVDPTTRSNINRLIGFADDGTNDDNQDGV